MVTKLVVQWAVSEDHLYLAHFQLPTLPQILAFEPARPFRGPNLEDAVLFGRDCTVRLCLLHRCINDAYNIWVVRTSGPLLPKQLPSRRQQQG